MQSDGGFLGIHQCVVLRIRLTEGSQIIENVIESLEGALGVGRFDGHCHLRQVILGSPTPDVLSTLIDDRRGHMTAAGGTRCALGWRALRS